MSSDASDRGNNPIIGGSYGTSEDADRSSGDGERAGAVRHEWQDDAANERSESEGGMRQMSDEARERATDAGQSMEDAKARVEQGREQVAGSIGRAAEQVRSRTQEQGGKAGQVGETVANRLDRTSRYLHEHDTDEMVHDFRTYVRKHPVQSVAAATITGFVVARILR